MEEKMVRDAAREYAQGSLAPRVLEAFRQEHTDPVDLSRDGRSRTVGHDHTRGVRRRRAQLRELRAHRARSRARGFRIPLHDERAVLAGHAAHSCIRQRRAKAPLSAAAGARRIDRLLRLDRTRSRLGSRQHGDARARRERRVSFDGFQDLDFQQPVRGRVRRLGQNRRRCDSRLHSREGLEGAVGAAAARQGRPARLDHRPNRHGRRLRAAGEPVAGRERTERTVHLPRFGAIRHFLGRARRGREPAGTPRAVMCSNASNSAVRWPPISSFKRSWSTCKPRSRWRCRPACGSDA